MKTQTVYLGIDVSKTLLHLAKPDAFIDEFKNVPSGHQQLIRRVKRMNPELIVLEASGGYERSLRDALQDAGLPVNVAQPSCVKYFAKSKKVLAKTDRIDAQVIAGYGEAIQPEITPKTPENVRKIRALCDRRQQIIEDRICEENRLETCPDKKIAAQIRASIKRLEKVEKKLDTEMRQLRNDDEQMASKAKVMMQQKGVGEVTTNTLLAHCPELGALNRQQAAALAGLAPYTQESGAWKGKSRIYAGRAAIRKVLFMAARTAARFCPVIKAFYERLMKAGKPFKVAIIACARKLLTRINTLLKNLQNPQPTLDN